MKTTQIQLSTLSNNRALKSTLKILFTGAIITTLFASCELSDDNNNAIIDIPLEISGEELAQSIEDNREQGLQTYTFDATTGGTILGDQGTNLVFGPNGLEDENGDLVTGDVEVSLMEVYKKADMVLSKLPTNGKNANQDIETIFSAGEFFVNVTQNGDQLYPSQGYQIFAPSDSFDPEITLFDAENGCANIDCDVVWVEDEDAIVLQGEGMGPDGTYVTGYTGFRETFGWTNLDRWAGYEGPKTLVGVDVPEGYNADNSNVYISYNGESALALLDIYDETNQLFTEHYGQIPIGQEVHFIFVSVQGGDYVYAIQAATIVDDHIEFMTTTQTATETQLFALIEALP